MDPGQAGRREFRGCDRCPIRMLDCHLAHVAHATADGPCVGRGHDNVVESTAVSRMRNIAHGAAAVSLVTPAQERLSRNATRSLLHSKPAVKLTCTWWGKKYLIKETNI